MPQAVVVMDSQQSPRQRPLQPKRSHRGQVRALHQLRRVRLLHRLHRELGQLRAQLASSLQCYITAYRFGILVGSNGGPPRRPEEGARATWAGPGPVMAKPAQPSARARQLAKADPPPLPLVTSQKAAAQAMALPLSWSHSCRDSFASAQEVASRRAEGG